MAPTPDQVLAGTGLWAYAIIAVVLLAEAVPVIGALIPAQLFMLGAGFLVTLHELHVYVLIPVAFASLFIADIVSFHFGRKYGDSIFDRMPSALALRARSLSVSLGRNAGKTLILGKFLGPARALTPPMAGAAGVTWPRFLAFEAVGSFLWVFLLTAIGILFGRSYHVAEKYLGRGSLVLILVAIVFYLTFMRLRAAKVEEKLGHHPLPPPPPAAPPP